MILNLSEEQKCNMINLVRGVIANKLGIKTVCEIFDDPFLSEKWGAFVTLHLGRSLRGCIGYIIGCMALKDTLNELAISSAFRDPRFPPLTVDEYTGINVEISLLSPIEPVRDINEIVIGRDGLIIRNGCNSGLLLPQVAVEQKWNVDEFIRHTCLKAGLPMNAINHRNTKLEKFSAYVFGEKRD